MAIEATTSPTLTFRIQSSEAEAASERLRGSLAELKSAIAAFASTSVSADGLKKLVGEVASFSGGVRTARTEFESMSRVVQEQSKKNAQAISAEISAVMERGRVTRDEAAKTAAALQRSAEAAGAVPPLSARAIVTAQQNGVPPAQAVQAAAPARPTVDGKDERDALTNLRRVADESTLLRRRLLETRRQTLEESASVQEGEVTARRQQIGGVLRPPVTIVRPAGPPAFEAVDGPVPAGASDAVHRLQGEVRELTGALRVLQIGAEQTSQKLKEVGATGANARLVRVGRTRGNISEAAAPGGATAPGSVSGLQDLKEAEAGLKRIGPAAAEATGHTQRFTAAQRDAHSAARGLAGGLGALWLTYGSTIPIIAGFAVAASLREAVKAGSEFEYQLKFIQGITGETDEKIKGLSDSFKALSKTNLFSATEVAQGGRVLAQAGFSAGEVQQALPSTLKLATAGEIQVPKAAEILQGITHAFDKDAKDIPNIAAAIGKAAAISATDIGEMGEAMKQASTVGLQFNVKLEEMGGLLAVLATRNIRSQSAGTSLINMFRELDPTTKKASEAFKVLGIQTDATTLKQKGVVRVMQEFAKAFSQFDQPSQNRLAETLFNNRGAKGFLNAIAEASGKLPEFTDQVAKAYTEANYLDQVMAKLSETTKFQFEQLKNQLGVSLIEGFEGSRTEILALLKDLQSAVSSPEFKEGVSALLSGFVSLITFLKENGGTIVATTGSLIAMRLAVSAFTALTAGTLVSAAASLSGIKGGLVGLAIFGGFTAGEWLAQFDTVRAAAGAMFEQQFHLINNFGKSWAATLVDGIALVVSKIPVVGSAFAEMLNRLSGGIRNLNVEEKPAAAPEKPKLTTVGVTRDQITSERGSLRGSENAVLEKQREEANKANRFGTKTFFPNFNRGGGGAANAANKLAQAEGADLLAEFKQKEDVVNQYVQQELAVLDVRKRYGVITEEYAQQESDRLTKIRVDGLAAIGAAEEDFLKKKIADPRLKAEDGSKQRLQTQLQTVLERNKRLQSDAVQADRIRDETATGKSLQIQREAEATGTKATEDVKKLAEQQDLKRQQDRLKVQSAVIPTVAALREDATLDTEKAFLNKRLEIEKEIAQFVDKGDEGSKAKAAALREVLPLLEEQKKLQAELNAQAAVDNYNAQREFTYGWEAAFKEYEESATNAAQKARDVFSVSTKAMEDFFTEFATTGKANFKGFVDSVTKGLAQIEAKSAAAELQKLINDTLPTLARITGGTSSGGSTAASLAGAIGGGVAGLFGGSNNASSVNYQNSFDNPVTGGGGGSAGFGGLISTGIGFLSQFFHTGGVVGHEVPMSRHIDPMVFAGAPRFHGGGLVADEVPIIAKKGEGVFTPQQMSRLAPVTSTAPATMQTMNNTTHIHINVPESMGRQTAKQTALHLSRFIGKTQRAYG